jgi:hypothetical protein
VQASTGLQHFSLHGFSQQVTGAEQAGSVGAAQPASQQSSAQRRETLRSRFDGQQPLPLPLLQQLLPAVPQAFGSTTQPLLPLLPQAPFVPQAFASQGAAQAGPLSQQVVEQPPLQHWLTRLRISRQPPNARLFGVLQHGGLMVEH